MNKEVIFVIHTLNIGGAERQVAGLASYLSQQGQSVQILLLDDAIVKFKVDQKVKIVCLNADITHVPLDNLSDCTLFSFKENNKHLKFKRNMQLRLTRWFSPKKSALVEKEIYYRFNYVDPLQAYLRNYPQAVVISRMLLPNIVALMAAENLPNRFVFMDASSPDYGLEKTDPSLVLRKRFLKNANGGVFQTPDERDYYDGFNTFSKKVIPNYLQSEKLPAPYQGQRRNVIVNFCRLAPQKDLTLLMDAFTDFYQEHSDYILEIYGNGGQRDSLLAYIEKNKLKDMVKLYPETPHVHEIVKDAAMFVSSSYREGISNSMLEALAIGLPVICTDCPAGGARMMIEDGVNGLLVPMKDQMALSEAMKKLAGNQVLCEKLSRNAIQIREKLKIENIGQQWMNIINGE